MLDYRFMDTPFELVPFIDMKKKQADQYIKWYIETIEQRISKLQQYIRDSGETFVLDKSPESLITLWTWFVNQIEVVMKDEEEIKREIKNLHLPSWMIPHIEEKKFSEKTVALGYDISAYFGEVVIKNNPGIYWGYLSKPKRLHGVNRPMLLGFAGDMQVYTYGRVEVCMWKTLNKSDNMYLYEVYEKCVRMITDAEMLQSK